ncbi:MAG: hypothetical protein WB792_09770 [Desulfobacterales bacterium]
MNTIKSDRMTISLTEETSAGSSSARKVVQRFLERANVRIDGHRPWDLKVNNGRFFKRVLIATAFFAAIFNPPHNSFLIL